MPLCSRLQPTRRAGSYSSLRSVVFTEGNGRELYQAVWGHKLHLVMISDQFTVFVEMADELKKRFGCFAEGMVVTVCPMLVVIAIDKVDLKVYGHHAFSAMLTMAAITLILGICPFIICWFSGPSIRPVLVTAILATLSSCSLLILTCFIAQLVVPEITLIILGVVFGFLVLLRAVLYYHRGNFVECQHDKILNESHEFLTGVTGVLFLGLEGLALEGHDDPMFEKGGPVAIASFILCATGVCMMYLEMTPPIDFTAGHIVRLTVTLDSFMAGGIFTLLMVIMFKLMRVPALLLLLPPLVIILELVYRVHIIHPAAVQMSVPASLELTKVTFTGFLAVSITVIRNTSPSKLTGCFLLFAAAAIVFGLSWRLLSQKNIRQSFTGTVSREYFDASVNLASLGTHVCIVIATVLLLAMAWTARGKPCYEMKPCTA